MAASDSGDRAGHPALPAPMPLEGEVLPPPSPAASSFPPDLAEQLRAIAERIRPRQQAIIENIIASGQDLIRAKTLLSHGRFLGWVATEFGMSARTAQNYMSVAREFGKTGATVSHLPAGLLYRLVERATPETAREKVRKWLSTGERPTPLQIGTLIAAERQKVPRRELTEKHQLRMKYDRVFANRNRRTKREKEQIAWRRKETFVQHICQICDQTKLPLIIDFLERAEPKEIREAGGRLRGFLRRKGYLGPMKDYRP
jgi:Protein of unknown function (DUF3102)